MRVNDLIASKESKQFDDVIKKKWLMFRYSNSQILFNTKYFVS